MTPLDHVVGSGVRDRKRLDVPLAELELGHTGLRGEPACLRELLSREVDAHDVPGRTDQAGCIEGVHARTAPQVHEGLAGSRGGQVEEMTHTRERVNGTRRDCGKPFWVVPEAHGELPAKLEVEPALRLLCHEAVHVLEPSPRADRHPLWSRPSGTSYINSTEYLNTLRASRYCQESS